MPILVIALFGAAVFHSAFFRIGSGSINVMNVLIVFTGITYLKTFFQITKNKKKFISANLSDRYIWAFFGVAVLSVTASYLGLYRLLASNDVIYNSEYIARQAYYLYFIPLIIITSRNIDTPKIILHIQKHYKTYFFLIYIFYILENKTNAIDVPCFFCLSTLLLMGRERDRVVDVSMLLFIELSPIDTGGEMTQVFCRVLCLLLFFASDNGWLLSPLTKISITIIIACYLLPFIPLEFVGLNPNTSWRLNYWGDELNQLLNTFGIGVGYGTSYATQDFIGEAVTGPFAATASYSVAERLFVVGSHNSFVSIAFRTGIVGVTLLLSYIRSCGNRKLIAKKNNYLIYITISTLLIICFNVGFESPVYFFLFAFAYTAFNSMTRATKYIEIGLDND